MTIAQDFSSVFGDPNARSKLASMTSAGHLVIPTFNLTTTSLRYLPKWFERLHEINSRTVPAHPHGNYFSDPATLGLVDNNVAPAILTTVGLSYLSLRNTISGSHQKSEYELIKRLYYQGHTHPQRVQNFLNKKRDHMLFVLGEFRRSANRRLFLRRPNLLVIAEYIAVFPDALNKFVNLPEATLTSLSDLGEPGFKALCSGPGFPDGLNRLCRRIGSDYTRGEHRRLHYIVSMALLDILTNIPASGNAVLTVPSPYSNLLTENDIYHLYTDYTNDFTVYFDGTDFVVNTTAIVPLGVQYPPAITNVSLLLKTGIPSGTGTASASSASRKRKHSGTRKKTIYVIDPVVSEKAEDYIEQTILQPQYGASLVRVGHTIGETLSLADGMVPGADFYVIDVGNNPTVFIEVKSITNDPPVDISLTRAEYLRACQCQVNGIPYRLILFNINNKQAFEEPNFATAISTTALDNIVQFVVHIG